MKRLAIVLAACAATPHQPAKPDPKQLALDRHRDLLALADTAHRTRGNCDALVAELRPLVARMQTHITELHHAAQDPALAKQVTTELRAYDAPDRGLDEQTGADLAQTYLGCKQNTTLLDLIDRIPAE